MSRRNDDDTRLYNCTKKYEEIVKQVLLLDELTESFDPTKKKKKKKKKNNGSNGNVEEKERFDEVIVETITKFLNDLNTVTHESSSSKPSDESCLVNQMAAD